MVWKWLDVCITAHWSGWWVDNLDKRRISQLDLYVLVAKMRMRSHDKFKVVVQAGCATL